MTWKNKIPGCFGVSDGLFAGHPNDQKRALELLNEVYDNNVSWSTLRSEMKSYLSQNYNDKNHVKVELEKVKKLFKPWLN